MIAFLSALQFLTIIPVRLKSVNEENLARSLIYFPVIGLIIGLTLAALNKILGFLGFGYLACDIFLVIFLIWITGGLHLDGLSDTMDAILSQKSRGEMLLIMRDSRIGVMGVLGLISVILLKIALLFSVNLSLFTVSLILMCILSRYAMVLSIFLFPYARQNGKAKVFSDGINGRIFIMTTVITLFFVFLFWQFKGLLVMAGIGIFTFIFSRAVTNKVGGITGDTLGALNELAEITALFFIILIS